MTTPDERAELDKGLKNVLPCSCIPAYKDRGLSAPDCAYCNHADDVIDFILAREASLREKNTKLRELVRRAEPAVKLSISMGNMLYNDWLASARAITEGRKV